jgi:hypothetical protein
MIVQITVQNHSPERTQDMFHLVQVLTMDREHTLLQFEEVTTVLDGDEVGPGLVHPDPRSTRIVTFDHQPYQTYLLVDPSNQFLTTEGGHIDLPRFLVGNELELHVTSPLG